MGHRSATATRPSASNRPRGERPSSRRRFLSRGVASLGVAVGLTGCAELLGQDPITVGYKPSMRTLQGPIMANGGFLDELDLSVEAKNYGGEKSSLTNDYANRDLEVLLGDIGRIINLYNSEARIVAANNVNDLGFLAGAEFAESWADEGPEAFATFNDERDRPFEIGVADVGLASLWLDGMGINEDLYGFTNTYASESTKTLLEQGTLDGAILSPPVASRLVSSMPSISRFDWVGNHVSNQPGGVMAMGPELWRDQPDAAMAIVGAHVKATEYINEAPSDTAGIASKAFEKEFSPALFKEILGSKYATYITDPTRIRTETDYLVDFTAATGVIDESVGADDVIRSEIYTDR